MSKREPGADLLRCVALLFVVIFHSFLNNGYYFEPQTGAAMWLAGSLRWLSVSCIGLFLMLTGYLKSGKTDIRSCYRGLLPVLLGYLLAAVITIPIRHFVFGDVQPFSVWVTRLFSFRAIYYGWYVGMYLGLILLSPFVNMLLESLRETKYLLALALVMLTLTAFPGATPLQLFPDDWRSIYPLTYYILGAAVRRLQPGIRSWLGISAALAAAMLLGAATVLSTDKTLSEAFTWQFADLWIVLITFLLFTTLYRVEVRPALGRLLAFGAGGCYGGYLLSHLLDAWCYRLVPAWNTPERYPMVFLFVTFPIFLLSLLGGSLLGKLTGRLLPYGKEESQWPH